MSAAAAAALNKAWTIVSTAPRWLMIGAVAIIVLIIIVIMGSVAKARRHLQKIKIRRRRATECSMSDTMTETIFVSVPSYRDPDCAATLLSLFNNARCPHRVYVGVFSQQRDSTNTHANANADQDILSEYVRLSKLHNCDSFTDNIRFLKVDASEARGPMFARSVIERKLYRNEKWYFNIDSHTRFSTDWDQHFIDQVADIARRTATPENRIVVTMYPGDTDSEAPGECSFDKLPPGSYFRAKQFNAEHGMLQIDGPLFAKRPPAAIETMFIGLNCCFSSADRLQICPFDPKCDYVFLGEETTMAARLWTSGFDFYNPPCMLVWHRWSRKYRPTFWENLRDETLFSETVRSERRFRNKQAMERLWGLLEMHQGKFASKAPEPKYGFGAVRSFKEYMRFSGVDWSRQQASLECWLGTTGGAGAIDASEAAAKFGNNGSRSATVAALRDARDRAGNALLAEPIDGGAAGNSATGVPTTTPTTTTTTTPLLVFTKM